MINNKLVKFRKKSQSNKEKFWMTKMPIELKKEMDRIRVERIKKGRDLEPKTYTRLGTAIVRFKPLWKVLEEADLKEDDLNYE